MASRASSSSTLLDGGASCSKLTLALLLARLSGAPGKGRLLPAPGVVVGGDEACPGGGKDADTDVGPRLWPWVCLWLGREGGEDETWACWASNLSSGTSVWPVRTL
jgi:hypothetical protein